MTPRKEQRCPSVLPETFEGEGNFDQWISHFESVAAVNGWSDAEKLLWLRVRLTGRAHMAYAQLGHEMQESYKGTKRVLKQRFEPDCKQALYKVEFESRKKKTSESWADLGDELCCLADKAFPTCRSKRGRN